MRFINFIVVLIIHTFSTSLSLCLVGAVCVKSMSLIGQVICKCTLVDLCAIGENDWLQSSDRRTDAGVQAVDCRRTDGLRNTPSRMNC